MLGFEECLSLFELLAAASPDYMDHISLLVSYTESVYNTLMQRAPGTRSIENMSILKINLGNDGNQG